MPKFYYNHFINQSRTNFINARFAEIISKISQNVIVVSKKIIQLINAM
jgi:hypothetical protein